MMQGSMTNWLLSLSIFMVFIPACLFAAWNYTGLCFPVRSALACGLALALSADHFLDQSLTHCIYSILCLRSSPILMRSNTFICVFIMVAGSVISFLVQSYASGVLEKWKRGDYIHLTQTLSSEFKIPS